MFKLNIFVFKNIYTKYIIIYILLINFQNQIIKILYLLQYILKFIFIL